MTPFDISKYTKGSIENYYSMTAEVHEAHRKMVEEATAGYDKLLRDLYEGKLLALDNAKSVLMLKENG